VVTTDRANGRSAAKYADDFYEQGGFGTGNENSGALFLIDMDNRELYICTAGAMIRYLTDERIEDLQDMAYDYAVDGAYGDAAQAVLSGMESFYKKGIPGNQYTYDVDTGKVVRHRSIRWYEFLLAFAAAAICGVTAVGSVRREYAMKSERTSAAGFNMAYRANAEFVYRTQNDKLVNSIVTHQIIPKTNSGGGFPGGGFSGGGSGAGRSTVHHTSGGNMHGGGGRKF
jgi:uncharacterized protein